MAKVARNGQARPLTQEEYQLLLEHLKQRKHKVLLRLMASTGARITELLHIRRDDLYTDPGGGGGVLLRKSNTKTKQTREVPLPPDLLQDLRDLAGNNQEYVFQSTHGNDKPLTRQSVDYIFRNALKELNIQGVSLHSTRRGFITNLVVHKNVPLPVVQKIVGHASLRSTSSYIQVRSDDLKNGISKIWQEV